MALWVVPWLETNLSKLLPSSPMWVFGLCHGFVIFLSTLTNLPWVCDVGLCFVVVVDVRVCGRSLITGSGGSLGWV